MTLRLCLVLLAALAVPAVAQQQPTPNLALQGQGAQGGVARIAFAHQLYAFGLANKDALTVLNAARLAASVTLTDTPRPKDSTADPAAIAAPPPLSPAQMFDTAATLAAADEALLDLVDASKREATFAPPVSVVSTTSILAPAQTDAWPVSFFGGSLAELAILGDRSGTLDLRVTDDNGALACLDAGASAAVYCGFYPADNGTFVISVTNKGTAAIAYMLLTN